ncbi:MAG: serine/threonine protein kinase, partial [Ruminococcus sp.]|nr:serine/threonine protein kinase [Ruminococcus sp.]
MDVSEKYPLALPKGTVLAGQYVIDSVLGQGGFGITYKATDHKTGENVAVKEYFPDTLAYRDATEVISYPGERSENFDYGKEGFLQEAQTLAQFIGNENIARIHSYFEENGTAYFVMEYIEGISFDEYIKRKGGKITVDEAERVLIPIMDALDAVHAAGIVHRDVTPDNIYICQDGKIKLLDFGAARYSLGDKSRSLDVILKHGFAPKEQYTRRGRQGPYTDIYSIAATFYFAITGKRPPDSVDRLDEDDLIPPSSLGVDITDYQEKALFTALEVQPQNRFQSMAVFKRVLLNERIAAAAPVNTPPPVAQQPDNTQAIPHTVAASPHPSPVPQVAANGMPAAQAKKSGGKKIAIGAACVAIAAAIGAAVLIPGLSKSDDDDDDKDSSSKHSAVAVDNSTSDDDGG